MSLLDKSVLKRLFDTEFGIGKNVLRARDKLNYTNTVTVFMS